MADVVSTVLSSVEAAIPGLAQAFNEDPDAVRRGFDAAVPGVLGGLIARSQTEDGAAEVRYALADAQTGPALLDNVAGKLDGVKLRGRASGSGLRLVGERGPALAQHLSSWAGLKPSSVSSMIDIAAPLVLAAIRRQGPPAGDTGRLRGFLDGQAAVAQRAMPAGFDPYAGLAVPERRIVPTVAPAAAPAPSRPWIWWLVALVAVIILVLVVLRSCGGPPDTAATTAPPPAAVGGATTAGSATAPPATGGRP